MRQRKYKIVDLGCGDAKIAQKFGDYLDITSIDHIKVNELVTPANMSNTNLRSNYFDIVILCLSLTWGNDEDLNSYIREVLRIIKDKGEVFIISTKRETDTLKAVLESNSEFKDKKDTPLYTKSKNENKFNYLKYIVIKGGLF